MKELSIKEKAKAYDEAIKRAKTLYDNNQPISGSNVIINNIFPELKEENGDERIRKALINGFNKLDKSAVWYNGITNGQILAWLEKQNLIMAKSPQLGKQKPANNNELKFKIGDWVVVDGITQKVTHIQTEGFKTDRAWKGKSTFKDVHLWTIADVKDCDVLVDVYGNVGIYKSHDDFSWLSYCSLGYYGGFQHFTIEHDNEKTYPATKEQQDTLFAKMREAGYEWDAEKKELKKISQRMISAEAKEAMYGNPAWSEEDEKMVNNILTPLAGRFPWNIYQPMYDWLKSLKDRIGG